MTSAFCSMSRTGRRLTVLLVSIAAGPPLAKAQGVREVGSQHRATSVARLPLPDGIGAPDVFVGSSEQLVLVDYSDMSIRRADATARWGATLRRPGSGPGEIRDVGGVQFAGNGDIWITDPANGRVSVRRADLQMVREFTTETPLRAVSPSAAGAAYVALASSAAELAILCSEDGRRLRSLGFPVDMEARNPITRERYLLRINDTLSLLQFRWYNRTIALRNDGKLLYDKVGEGAGPEVLAIPLDKKGSMAYRVHPKAREYAIAAASRGDTVFVLLGHADPALHGKRIARFRASTWNPIDVLDLPMVVTRIAATKRGLFAIAESDDGYVLNEIRWK